MNKIKVLHIVPNMQAGGLETFIMNIMYNIDRKKIQFDFLVHYKERKFYDDEIESLGGKFTNNVTNKTKYLIVGNKGNPCWAFSCYGRKIGTTGGI